MNLLHSPLRSRRAQPRQGKTAVALTLTLLLLLPLPLLAESAAPRPGAGSLNFLVISDWGAKGGATQVAVAEQMGRTAAAQKSRFVITCGDNYHGSGIASADSPRWKTEYENGYNNPALMIPWYATLGNHDYRGRVEAEIAYSKISSAGSCRRGITRIPKRSTARTRRCLFIWIRHPSLLTIIRRTRFIVCRARIPRLNCAGLHRSWRHHVSAGRSWLGLHPIYAAAPRHGDTKELIADVLPLLQKYGVQTLLLRARPRAATSCPWRNQLLRLRRRFLASERLTSAKTFRFGAGSAGFLSMTLTGTAAQAIYIDDKGVELYGRIFQGPDPLPQNRRLSSSGITVNW